MNFNLSLTDKELEHVVNTLAQRPWLEVQALIANISAQVQQQQREPELTGVAPPERTPRPGLLNGSHPQ